MSFSPASDGARGFPPLRLWLDDVRDPRKHGHGGWFWVKTAEEAIELFKTCAVAEASLDHDLTEEQTLGGLYGVVREDGQKSGYDVVVWLEEHPQYRPSGHIFVHSMNPAGRKRMLQVIDRINREDI